MPNPNALGEQYFRDHFNTPLTPEQEQAYGAWAAAQSRTRGFDIGDARDYDMRGYWKNADPGELNARQGHFTDTYKKPNHPTFSKESQYNNAPNELTGGTWQGGVWGDRTFTPSAEMLQTHPINWLQNYMRKVEPDYKLVLPAQ